MIDETRTPTIEPMDRIDADLRAFVTDTAIDLSPDALAGSRERVDKWKGQLAEAVDPGAVRIESTATVGSQGQRIRLRVYRGSTDVSPLVLYAHGGAYVLGNLDTDHRHCVKLAESVGCTVVSVEYRLAPEHPCPAAIDDLEFALRHVVAHAADFDVDPDRIALVGRDAGAGLLAALAQRLFDNEGPAIALQVLHQPILDCDPTPSKLEFRATPGLNGQGVDDAWKHYLGTTEPRASIVPAMRENFEGLPPAYISCAEVDPVRDEGIDYATRLLRAYVRTELHVVPGAFHGFDSIDVHGPLAREIESLHTRALRAAFRMDV